MISVRHDNPAGRALRLIGELPDEVDGRAIADHLRPLPRLTGTADYPAWRAAVLASRGQREAWGSRLLSRLQERGLVGTVGAPRLSDWYSEWAARIGYRRALAVTLLCSPDDVPPALLRLIMALVENPPGSVADLIGVQPSGRKRVTYRAACDLGVIIPPSRRRLTDAGRALVESWNPPTGEPHATH